MQSLGGGRHRHYPIRAGHSSHARTCSFFVRHNESTLDLESRLRQGACFVYKYFWKASYSGLTASWVASVQDWKKQNPKQGRCSSDLIFFGSKPINQNKKTIKLSAIPAFIRILLQL
jgi:hypothetical protein